MLQKTEHITLILLLAGSGSRYDSSIPKQFIHLNGIEKPLFIQSLLALSKHLIIDHLILVVNPAYIKNKTFTDPLSEYKEIYKESVPTLKIDVVEGGATRHESFMKGAALVIAHENHTLVVHDANRPFISDAFGVTIAEQINTLSTQRACLIPVIPSVDSLCKLSDAGKIIHYMPRDNTFRIQTPQLIYTVSLEQALIKSKKFKSETEYTDEGSFMLSMGFGVYTFAGDPGNIKITTKDDLI